jgi:hypothetical protein
MSAELDREAFVEAMADHYVGQTNLARTQALEYAWITLSEHLNDEGIEFGADGYAWTASGAVALVDEELTGWADA